MELNKDMKLGEGEQDDGDVIEQSEVSEGMEDNQPREQVSLELPNGFKVTLISTRFDVVQLAELSARMNADFMKGNNNNKSRGYAG